MTSPKRSGTPRTATTSAKHPQTTGHNYDPDQHAHELALTVHTFPLPHPELGRYYIDQQAITLTTGLLTVQRRCVLAHEIAHHVLGHDGQGGAKAEHQADRLAVDWLIHPDEYMAARSQAVSLNDLLLQLQVTGRFFRFWYNTHTERHHS